MNNSPTSKGGTAAPVETSLFSLLHAAKALEERLEAKLSEVGLSGAKFSALTVLANAADPLALSEMAERQSCVRSNITQLVDRLEADGLVRRVADPTDRRSIRAAITPLGRERQRAGAKRVNELQREFAEAISAQDQQALRRALTALGD
jgi:DNA-binding MarR family transcriptional regulator